MSDDDWPIFPTQESQQASGPDENFRPVIEEIRRQHDLTWILNSARDDKIGIILGFVFVILLQIVLASDTIDSVKNNNAMELGLFIVGLVSILSAAVLGMVAYRTRDYKDAEIEKAFKLSKLGDLDGKEFEKDLAEVLWNSFQFNRKQSDNKVRYIKWTLRALFVGVITFVARFALLVLT